MLEYRHFVAGGGGAEKHAEDRETGHVLAEEKPLLSGLPYFPVSFFGCDFWVLLVLWGFLVSGGFFVAFFFLFKGVKWS